jgi:glucosamine kinase
MVCLGLDVGGTAARWAALDAAGGVIAQGESPGFSAAQWGGAAQTALEAAVQACAKSVAARALSVQTVCAGLTGCDGVQAELTAFMARQFAVPVQHLRLMSDIELACRAHFAPGQGIVLIAGTGSIAAHLDAQGQLHRAGGRGVLLDDAGGGYWIAREALRAVWRREDEAPGSTHSNVLAQQLFAALGGSDWMHTRHFMAHAARGQMGALAVAVAQAAQLGDAQALALLQQAGAELRRLLRAMTQRVGEQPVALCGRAFDLHAAIEAAVRQAQPHVKITRFNTNLALAAARLASSA